MRRADEAAAAAAAAAAEQEGEGVVASGGGGEGLSRREWAALVTRLGEKRLLHAVVGELRGEPSGGLEQASPP